MIRRMTNLSLAILLVFLAVCALSTDLLFDLGDSVALHHYFTWRVS
jgi:hypothetical protein